MHGPHRVPTLLKRADQLARGHATPDPAKALAGQMN
jgi:deoxyribonuclease V